MPAGKEERGGGGPGGPLGFRLGRKELTPGGKEGEGRREGAEGGSIPAPLQGQALLSGALKEARCCARFTQLQSLA